MTEPRNTRPTDRPADRPLDRPTDPTVDPVTGRPAGTTTDPISPTGTPAVGRGRSGRNTWVWAAVLALVVIVVLWALFGMGDATVNDPGTATIEPGTTGEAITPPVEPAPAQ